MVNLGYAWEKLYVAVLALAKGSNEIQDRLHGAYLSFCTLTVDDFPKDLQKDFKGIMDKLTTAEPIRDEGIVKATLNQMSEEDANILAEKIVSLYNAVTGKLAIERS